MVMTKDTKADYLYGDVDVIEFNGVVEEMKFRIQGTSDTAANITFNGDDALIIIQAFRSPGGRNSTQGLAGYAIAVQTAVNVYTKYVTRG